MIPKMDKKFDGQACYVYLAKERTSKPAEGPPGPGWRSIVRGENDPPLVIGAKLLFEGQEWYIQAVSVGDEPLVLYG